MYSIVVKFNNLNGLSINETLNELPIKNYSNGSLVCMKGEKPWLDYCNVPLQKVIELMEYLDNKKSKDIEITGLKYKI